MAEICTISAFYFLKEVTATSAAEREPLYKTLAGERPAWARIFRKNLDSKAPPVKTKAKPESNRSGYLRRATGYRRAEWHSGILRPRQEAVSAFPAALHEGGKGEPPCTALLEPKLKEAPLAPQYSADKRAAEREGASVGDRRPHALFLKRAISPCATSDTSSQLELRGLGESSAVCERRLRVSLIR